MNRHSSDSDHEISDDYTYTIKTSLRRSPLDSVFTKSRPYAEDALLTFEDIITDKEALEFLNKHFPKIKTDCIDIESFLDALLQEFFLRNPSITDTVEDIQEFREELRELLRRSLTTNDDEMVSLNALEVNTKKKGLYTFVTKLANEAKNTTQIQKSQQINQAVAEELSVLTQMLDNKQKELIGYEQRLKEYDQSLTEREGKMKKLLKIEYERLFKTFEDSYREKMDTVQKKLTNHEKSFRFKVKQCESQLKEMKSHTSSMSGTEDKLKFKVSSLEKTNNFLKLKAQELEKKVEQELQNKQSMTQKNQKLVSKISVLEKSVKDLQTGHLAASQSLHRHTESEPAHFAKYDEKPLEVVDLNASQSKLWEESEQMERSPSPDAKEKEEENIAKAKKIQKTTTATATKKTGKAAAVIEVSPVKKGSVTKAAPSGEFKVLLNVVHSLMVCLKSTLPVFMHSGKEGRDTRREQSPVKSEHGAGDENGQVDLGEVFYPCFDSLIANLTEIMPIIGKQYEYKHVSSIMEVYYKLINFFFKFKIQQKFENYNVEHRLLSEYDIQHSAEKIKTSQDHVNEIMTTAKTSKGSLEVNFVPQTDHWKKIIKSTKPLQKAKTGTDLQSSLFHSLHKDTKGPSTKQSNYINLFSEELVQKEVVAVLKKFLDSSEVLLKGNEKDTNLNTSVLPSSLNLETQKYLQMNRLYGALTAILLAKNKKEQLLGLQALLFDLNIDNMKLAEFVRLFLIDNDGLNVLFWVLQNYVDDFEVVQLATDVLLSLNYNGAHYRTFIETISKDENIAVIFDVLMKYGDNNEFCEKMSVIVQRITYHNPLQGRQILSKSEIINRFLGKIPDKYIRFLKEKLNEQEIIKNNQFFTANIKSILLNLNA